MKTILVLVTILLFRVSCQAQIIFSCEDIKPDTSACAKVVASVLKNSNGHLKYRNVPLEICSRGGSFNIAFGLSELYRKASAHIDCEDISSGKPFNNKRNGLKQGLWFKLTLLGRVKSATEYDSGQAGIVIDFWPNGLPKHLVKYKPSGKFVEGSTENFKKYKTAYSVD